MVPNLADCKVVDFACGDQFCTLISTSEHVTLTAEMYREFKYASNKKIINKIFPQEIKKPQLRRRMTRGESLILGPDHQGKIMTQSMNNFIVKQDTIFNFRSAIVKETPERVNFQNIEEKVKEFFGLIDFTKLPLHLLSLEEKDRNSNLKREVKRLVNDLCVYSTDFKSFLGNFDKIARTIGERNDVDFDEVFFKQIMKDPLIKKIVPQIQQKRKKGYMLGRNKSAARLSLLNRSMISERVPTEVAEPYDQVTALVNSVYEQKEAKLKNRDLRPVSSLTSLNKKYNLEKIRKIEIEEKSTIAKKRLKTIKCLSKNNIRIKTEQKRIMKNVYIKKKEDMYASKRSKIREKLEEKHEKNKMKKFIKQEQQDHIISFRYWQKEWIKIHALSVIMLRVKILVENAKEIEKENLRYERSIRVIQKFWQVKCCQRKIANHFTMRQMFCISILSVKVKVQVQKRKKRLALKEICKKLVINRPRKNLRLMVSKMKTGLKKIHAFIQYSNQCYQERSKSVICQWDLYILKVILPFLLLESDLEVKEREPGQPLHEVEARPPDLQRDPEGLPLQPRAGEQHCPKAQEHRAGLQESRRLPQVYDDQDQRVHDRHPPEEPPNRDCLHLPQQGDIWDHREWGQRKERWFPE